MVDLGAWLAEEHKLPGEGLDELEGGDSPKA
jgi:endogenous inhibitor of DNA gyrase (YacG/DUF329 family)